MSFSLRKMEPDDLPLLYAWENDASSWSESDTHNPLSRQDLRDYIASTTGDIYRDGQLRLMIVRSSSEEVLPNETDADDNPNGKNGRTATISNRYVSPSHQPITSSSHQEDIHGERDHERCGCIDLFDFDARNRKAAIGLYVSPSARGGGVGYAALQLLLRYAFGFLHLRMLYAVISVHNEPCTRLFRKAGFMPSARLSNWTLEGDAVVWQCVNEA